MIDGQVVLVPVLVADESKNFAIVQKLTEMRIRLETAGIRCHIDDRRHVRHGAKYFEWERKGVPIRLELGMRDISNNVVVLAPRVDTAATLPESASSPAKVTMTLDSAFADGVASKLKEIQFSLLDRARARLRSHIRRVTSYADMKDHLLLSSNALGGLGSSNEAGLYLAPWHANDTNEQFIKDDCKATIRCYPQEFNNNANVLDNAKCFFSGQPATHLALFGRAF
jgi:prolyl-tRNA synthetase